MKYLLDTNAIILALSGRGGNLRDRMSMTDEGDMVTSAVAYAEVALGTARDKLPAFDVLDQFTDEVRVLPFDQEAAKAYASLPFRRGSIDRLIAAHALSLGLTLVTANVPDFADVPDLKVENWTL